MAMPIYLMSLPLPKRWPGQLSGYSVIVTKSTVPVGTGRQVEEIVRTANPDADFDVVSNPEFLREGSAIGDFMRPDRVVVGAETERSIAMMRALIALISYRKAGFIGLETAELIKYAANAFLAVKISYINQMADLCEAVGADVHDVAKGMGLDNRIGSKFLHPGPRLWRFVFSKDTLALVKTAELFDVPVSIISEVVAYNAARKAAMAGRVITACDGDVSGKQIAILGLAFKPETDDMRESPAIEIIEELIKKSGANITAYDPAAMTEARPILPDNVFMPPLPRPVSSGADCAVVVTEWNEFRALTPQVFGKLLRLNLVDLRNIYDGEAMRDQGMKISVDWPEIKFNSFPSKRKIRQKKQKKMHFTRPENLPKIMVAPNGHAAPNRIIRPFP